MQARLDAWLAEIIADKLKPLSDIAKAEDISGLARGIAYRLKESFGILKRELVADEMKHLDQTARAQLRKYGVRFGAFNIYFPLLLKPAAAELAATLWALRHSAANGLSLDALPEPPRPGLTSVAAEAATPEAFYRACGFHVCGPRAVRLDILERLADLIRPLLAWRPGPEPSATPPKGSTGDGGFTVTPEMMSILGCSPDELGDVLKALGFKLERRPQKAATPPANGEAQVASPEPAAAEAAEPVAPVATGVAEEPAPAAAAASTDGTAASDVSPAAPALDAAPDAAKEPAPTAEPAFLEIWRPRRHHHGEGKDRRRNRNDRNASPSPARSAGSPAAPAEQGTSSAPAASERAPRGPDRQGKPSDEHAQRRPRGHERHRARSDRDGTRDGGRSERRGNERRRSDERAPPAMLSAGPPKKAAIDPDSPFASLGALREALEKQAREKNSS